MNTPVTFEIAKLLKEKGFDKEYRTFYTKPNSKMFGIDEHYRNYPIKNTSKKLYIVGVHAVLNIENVYPAPIIAEVIMWLYEKHGIWISVNTLGEAKDYPKWTYTPINLKDVNSNIDWALEELSKTYEELIKDSFNSPTEAYLAAIEYTLKNLI